MTAYRLLAMAMLAVGVGACSKTPTPQALPVPPPLASVVVDAVQSPREQVWDGVVAAVAETTLAAQTNARVLATPFDVGDRVAKGAVLLRLSDVEQRSGRSVATAAVARASAEAMDAEANWKRTREVFARGLVAQAQLDAATARRDAANAEWTAAQAALRAAGQQARYTEVRAPFAGVITRRFVEVGEAVQSGPPAPQALITLASLDALRVEVQVPQSAAAVIRKFHTATVVLPGGDGERVAVDKLTLFPWADPLSHSFRVRVQLPAGIHDLYPGMTVKVAFATGVSQRLMLPIAALVQRGEVSSVYVLGSGHAVSLRQLRLGHRYGDKVDVLAGLAAGETVATDPDAAAAYLAQLHAAGKLSP